MREETPGPFRRGQGTTHFSTSYHKPAPALQAWSTMVIWAGVADVTGYTLRQWQARTIVLYGQSCFNCPTTTTRTTKKTRRLSRIAGCPLLLCGKLPRREWLLQGVRVGRCCLAMCPRGGFSRPGTFPSKSRLPKLRQHPHENSTETENKLSTTTRICCSDRSNSRMARFRFVPQLPA